MRIDKQSKTIAIKPYELVVAVNYIEHVVEEADRKTWKLVPELTVEKRPVERVKKSGR